MFFRCLPVQKPCISQTRTNESTFVCCYTCFTAEGKKLAHLTADSLKSSPNHHRRGSPWKTLTVSLCNSECPYLSWCKWIRFLHPMLLLGVLGHFYIPCYLSKYMFFGQQAINLTVQLTFICVKSNMTSTLTKCGYVKRVDRCRNRTPVSLHVFVYEKWGQDTNWCHPAAIATGVRHLTSNLLILKHTLRGHLLLTLTAGSTESF